MDRLKETKMPYVLEGALPDSNEYITIVTVKSVYKGLLNSTLKRHADKQFLESLKIGKLYQEIEEGVFESDFMTVILVDDSAYEIMAGQRMSRERFLKKLEKKG